MDTLRVNTDALHDTSQLLNGISQTLENTAQQLENLDFEDIGHPVLELPGFRLNANGYTCKGGSDLEEWMSECSNALKETGVLASGIHQRMNRCIEIFSECEEKITSFVEGTESEASVDMKEDIQRIGSIFSAVNSETDSRAKTMKASAPMYNMSAEDNKTTKLTKEGSKKLVETLYGKDAFSNNWPFFWQEKYPELHDLRDLLMKDSSELTLDQKIRVVTMLKGQIIYARNTSSRNSESLIKEMNAELFGLLSSEEELKDSVDILIKINEAIGQISNQSTIEKIEDCLIEKERDNGFAGYNPINPGIPINDSNYDASGSRTGASYIAKPDQNAEAWADLIVEYERQIREETKNGK